RLPDALGLLPPGLADRGALQQYGRSRSRRAALAARGAPRRYGPRRGRGAGGGAVLARRPRQSAPALYRPQPARRNGAGGDAAARRPAPAAGGLTVSRGLVAALQH